MILVGKWCDVDKGIGEEGGDGEALVGILKVSLVVKGGDLIQAFLIKCGYYDSHLYLCQTVLRLPTFRFHIDCCIISVVMFIIQMKYLPIGLLRFTKTNITVLMKYVYVMSEREGLTKYAIIPGSMLPVLVLFQ